MTKAIKNKDGIELLVGQVWKANSSKVRTVIGFTSKGKAVTEQEKGAVRSWEQADVFHRLISCPVMGDMSNHLIVTAEQKKQYLEPRCAEWFADGEWKKSISVGASFAKDITYRVPADFDAWLPIEPIDPPKPEFKLFEIDHSKQHMYIYDKCNITYCPTRPTIVDGYRVGWGFTDDLDDDTDLTDYVNRNLYDRQPCDHTGDRKYAIGRLVK